MVSKEPMRFCLITCLLKRLVKYLLELWLYITEYYLGSYVTLCEVFQFWPRVFWLAVRTRGYMPARCNSGYSKDAANACIDELLSRTFVEYMYGLSGAQETVKRLYKRLGFFDVRGETELFCCMNGLETLHRINDASLKKENGQVKLKAELRAEVLHIFSSGKIKIMNVGPIFALVGKIECAEVHVELSYDFETGRNGRLEEFVIYDMQELDIQVTSFNPIDLVLNQIIALKIFRRFFKNLIELRVESYIRENIQDFQFPLYFGLERKVARNHTSAVEPTKSTREPIAAEALNEQIADAEHDSGGKSETSVEKTAETTDIPELNPAIKVSREQITHATEQDSDGKSGTSVQETIEATDSAEFNSALKEVAGEQIADATEQDYEGKSETRVKKTADFPEFNTTVKVAEADDPAFVRSSELGKGSDATTLSAVNTSGSDLETPCDISDLD